MPCCAGIEKQPVRSGIFNIHAAISGKRRKLIDINRKWRISGIETARSSINRNSKLADFATGLQRQGFGMERGTRAAVIHDRSGSIQVHLAIVTGIDIPDDNIALRIGKTDICRRKNKIGHKRIARRKDHHSNSRTRRAVSNQNIAICRRHRYPLKIGRTAVDKVQVNVLVKR